MQIQQIRSPMAWCKSANLIQSHKTLLWAENVVLKQHTRGNRASAQGNYAGDMYQAWVRDPASVHPSWDYHFRTAKSGSPAPSEGSVSDVDIQTHLTVQSIIRSYQVRGHLVAKTDPLGIMYEGKKTYTETNSTLPPEITIQHQIDQSQMEKTFRLPLVTYIGGNDRELPLKEIIRRLELTYCRHIGVEFMYITNPEEISWLKQKLEPPNAGQLSANEKKLLLKRLTRSGHFELFLARKWKSEKRFGLEGCEVMIPVMKQIIDTSSTLGLESVIIGMPHRGRLNVLVNICRRPLYEVFTQFHGLEPADEGSGDVKYHLGTHIERTNTQTNKKIRLALVANPSHLEVSAPVVQGKARAEQNNINDHDGTKVMSMLLHGDAAFCGQGVVYETMHLSYLPAYTTRGTIHIVVNNQVGFTTDPRFSRSSRYCSDVGRVVNAPIFHVNSDCPESCMHVSKIAAEYRAKFHKDVVIDIVSYRRNGHNEADEPMFTQPLMYQRIGQIKPIVDKYGETLVKSGVITPAEVKTYIDEYETILNSEYEKSLTQKTIRIDSWLDSPWKGWFKGKDPLKTVPTGIKEADLNHIINIYAAPPPPDFKIHSGIDRILKGRAAFIAQKSGDWSFGEALAFGSLLKEGFHVRLSGEDVERGTFSHRHHVLHHQTVDGATYNPFEHISPNQGKYSVSNSSLSEYAVLCFEHGYAMANPNALVIWEAQFGDFVNTGQCCIDQFISAGQDKWVRQNGLVVLLPHSLEGMGPEHSSARIERFLIMCSDDPDTPPPESPETPIKQLKECNWIVANCTTPANIFHLFRRQVYLPFRKPCIVMSPKSLLRHPEARSPFSDYLEGTEFRRIIPDAQEASSSPDGVKKLVFCTGKVYYDFTKHRKDQNLVKDIAVTRVEQVSPFPYDLIKAECAKYPNAKLFWGQEEHKNQGAFNYVRPRFEALIPSRDLHYVGRGSSAASATGLKSQFKKQFKALMNDFAAL